MNPLTNFTESASDRQIRRSEETRKSAEREAMKRARRWWKRRLRKMTNTIHPASQVIGHHRLRSDYGPATSAILAKLTDKISTPSDRAPEARKPDKFEGTDKTKLRTFLTQCRLVFLAHEHRFKTDKPKVLFAGSYLGGVAADWFEPITGSEDDHRLALLHTIGTNSKRNWNAFSATRTTTHLWSGR